MSLRKTLAVWVATLGMLTCAATARARTLTIDGTVTVDTINDPLASEGASIGDVAHYHAVFNDSDLVDITLAANALYGGSTSDIRVASLSDPGASFSLEFNGDTFTQDVSEGVDASGLGVPYPYVIYHGDTFWGFDILVQRSDGFEVRDGDIRCIVQILSLDEDD